MAEQPLISVIFPIYNVESVLRRSVASVLAQTYRNLELILVDDGSPDGCPAICDEYAAADSRVKVFHHKNGGGSTARNRGVDEATGEYIAFVDPDDYVEPDFIDFLYNLLTENAADIASCGALEVYPNGRTQPQCADTALHIMDTREAMERMCYNDGFYITLWDKLFKASLFEGVRFPEGKLFEDTGTTYLLVHNAQKIAACCEIKYYYVISAKATSITTSGFKMSKLDYVEMADNMANFIRVHYEGLDTAAARKQMHACFSTLTQLVNSGVRKPLVEQELIARIRELRPGALKDPRTPRRDRLALFALQLGYPFFSFVWRLYNGRKWRGAAG